MLSAETSAGEGSFLPGLALALAIGLLVGIERGWSLRDEAAGGRVAGIRTFALLGLSGGIAGVAHGVGLDLFGGALIVGAISALLVGYHADIRRDDNVSATSTVAGVLTVALGALAAAGHMAVASVGAGAAVILLASRQALHGALRVANEADVRALLRLVLVVFVILPLLPDRPVDPLGALNPQRLWFVVVVTGSVGFVGYILARWLGTRRGALLTGAVGALVSSTAVTVDCARALRDGNVEGTPHAAVALASGVMLLRSLVLVGLVAPVALPQFAALVLPGLAVSALAMLVLLWRTGRRGGTVESRAARAPGLSLAFLFAMSVALLSLAAAWLQARWGESSGALLIAIGGTVDIDAAIAAIGALPRNSMSPSVAALALAAPTLLNTLFKLILLVGIARRRALDGALALGATSLALLLPVALALAAQV